MSLFRSLKGKEITNVNPLICATPIGEVLFEFGFNNQQIKEMPSSKTVTEDNAFILNWNFKECEVEFLSVDFIPQIPSGMKIDRCIAGIWRVKSLCALLNLTFKAIVLDKSIKMNSETGEGLVSCLYETAETKLSIGTEDEEYLASRAHMQNWMPNRLESILLKTSIVESDVDGLKVVLPSLELNEVVQIQFILAWSSQKQSNSSTWYAVDQRANLILNQFGMI